MLHSHANNAQQILPSNKHTHTEKGRQRITNLINSSGQVAIFTNQPAITGFVSYCVVFIMTHVEIHGRVAIYTLSSNCWQQTSMFPVLQYFVFIPRYGA